MVDENDPSQLMRRAIDSLHGPALSSRRIATVQFVLADIRHHERMSRLTLRGKDKVAAQWRLCRLAHYIEKIVTKAM